MPITTSFDPYTPEVIPPAATVRPIPGFPTTLIVTFQPRTFAVLLQQYATTPVTLLELEEPPETPTPLTPGWVHSFTYAGQTLGAYLSPIGAPAAVAVMEKAIALGTRRFVIFGSCGTLTPDLPPGALIVPSYAYRDEGTSYHYTHARDYLPLPTAARTARILGEIGAPHLVGKVWTTDAFFRETQGNLAKHVAEGCVAVDMETSALAALASFRSVEMYHFLYAADSLTGDTWDRGVLGTLPAEPRARYLRIAAELAVRA